MSNELNRKKPATAFAPSCNLSVSQLPVEDAVINQSLEYLIEKAFSIRPVSFKLVSDHGNSNHTYQVTGKDATKFALQISKIGPEYTLANYKAERVVLDRLSPHYPFIPKLVGQEEPVIWEKDNLVTLYEWVDTQPYRGTTKQLISTASAVSQIENALKQVRFDNLGEDFVHPEYQLVNFFPSRFEKNANFGFLRFKQDIEDGYMDATSEFLRSNLEFLERERDSILQGMQSGSPIFNTDAIHIKHSDLTPYNMGYDPDGNVVMVFDFHSLRYGLREQDIAWAISIMCIDPRTDWDCAKQKMELVLPIIKRGLDLGQESREALLLFMRLRHLESVHRYLMRKYYANDDRPNFVEKNIESLKWIGSFESDLQALLSK